MARPVVGFPTNMKRIDSSLAHTTGTVYVTGLTRYCDIVPILLPCLKDGQIAGGVEAYLPLLDGLLFTGAIANIHPSAYGHSETEEHAPFDRLRDATSMPLMRAAIERDMPILAICRGYQEMNVIHGGTLHPAIHTLDGRIDHREIKADSREEIFTARHSVSFPEGGILRDLISVATARVNSLHRQGIDRLGDGLRVEAYAEDGTIEAISRPDKTFVIGVQWHPEYQLGENVISEPLFGAFETALQNYQRQK